MTDFFLIKLNGKLCNDSTPVFAKISLRWIDQVSKHKWYLGKNGYPFAYIKHSKYTSRLFLHRYIHWLQFRYWTNLYVDHINRDKLDATDENLREATAAENSYNKTNTNPMHNIKFNEYKQTYEVSICKNGQIHKISDIDNLKSAQEIYKFMAEDLFGTFAPG